jgi:hypothetical protein
MTLYSHRSSGSFTTALLLSALLLSAAVGQAQEPASAPQPSDHSPTVRANALFSAAKQQQRAGYLAAACASYEESYQLAPRGGTLINLALCHRQLGELVVARQELLKARAVAERDGRADRAAIANTHLSGLEQELSWVDVGPAADIGVTAASISIDGQVIAGAAEAAATALMPGEHRIRIEADGFEPFELHIRLVAGAHTRVPLEPLRRRLIVPPASPEPSPAELPVAPARATAATPPAPQDAYSVWRSTSLVLAIVGMAGGLSAGAWALERRSAVHRYCDATTKECSHQKGLDAASLGKSLALGSTVACSVGLTGLGVWLLLPGGALNEAAPAAASRVGITWSRKF